jgi:UDP-N-acetyl-2-amino-2-deoxyglucuronate dehydrogenase
MSEEIRYGILGCSSMGDSHARALERVDGTTLVACADINEEIARTFADENGCEWYTDPLEMVQASGVEAVSVCTPNGTHAEIVVKLSEVGVNVLCEKPLDISVSKIDRMIEACEESGVTLGCIFQRRTMFGPQLAHQAVNDGRFGDSIMADVQVKWHRERPYFEAASWRGTTDLDGGVLLTQALHGIDLLQWIVDDVERVCAKVKTLHHDIDVPDTAVLSVECVDGSVGQVSSSTAVYPQHPITVQIHGTEGSFRWHEDEIDAFVTMDGPVDYEDETVPVEKGHVGQIRDFVDAVRDGGEPMVDGREGRKAVAIAEAARVSSEEDRWVDVDEL